MNYKQFHRIYHKEWNIIEKFQEAYEWQVQSSYGRYLKQFSLTLSEEEFTILVQSEKSVPDLLPKYLKEKRLIRVIEDVSLAIKFIYDCMSNIGLDNADNFNPEKIAQLKASAEEDPKLLNKAKLNECKAKGIKENLIIQVARHLYEDMINLYKVQLALFTKYVDYLKKEAQGENPPTVDDYQVLYCFLLKFPTSRQETMIIDSQMRQLPQMKVGHIEPLVFPMIPAETVIRCEEDINKYTGFKCVFTGLIEITDSVAEALAGKNARTSNREIDFNDNTDFDVQDDLQNEKLFNVVMNRRKKLREQKLAEEAKQGS